LTVTPDALLRCPLTRSVRRQTCKRLRRNTRQTEQTGVLISLSHPSIFEHMIINIFDTIQLLQRMHDLIARKSTGTSAQMAERLEMGRTTLYRRLEDLKSLGAPLCYDKERRSFCYTKPYNFPIRIILPGQEE
jgi:DNA-binding phage protein